MRHFCSFFVTTVPRILLLRGPYLVQARAKRLSGGRLRAVPRLRMVPKNDVSTAPCFTQFYDEITKNSANSRGRPLSRRVTRPRYGQRSSSRLKPGKYQLFSRSTVLGTRRTSFRVLSIPAYSSVGLYNDDVTDDVIISRSTVPGLTQTWK